MKFIAGLTHVALTLICLSLVGGSIFAAPASTAAVGQSWAAIDLSLLLLGAQDAAVSTGGAAAPS